MTTEMTTDMTQANPATMTRKPRRALRLRIALLAASLMMLTANMNAYGYDLFGGDMGGFLLPVSSDPVANSDRCNAACSGTPGCVAWTMAMAPVGHPTNPACFLKNAVSEPSLNSVCTSNSVCLSGVMRGDGWCGETPARDVGSSGVPGQGQVLSCGPGQTCGPLTIQGPDEVCWFLFFPYPCHGPSIQTTDFFCR
jgi:PAN domain